MKAKNIFTLFFILLGYTSLYAQNIKKDTTIMMSPIIDYISTNDSDKVYMNAKVNVQPQFPGDVKKYIADNIQYPDSARQKNIQGAVYVSFIIEKNGSVSSITILRTPDTSLSNEARRLVSTMPRWAPGTQNGKL